MYNIIYNLLSHIGTFRYTGFAAYVISCVAILLICITLKFVVKYIVVKTATGIVSKTINTHDNVLLSNKFFQRLSNLTVPAVLSLFVNTLPERIGIFEITVSISTIVVLLLIIDSVINTADEIYRGFEISKVRPLRSVFQVLKVAVYIISGVMAIAALIGESPMMLIGGISAMTAVTSIVFKDAILGFIAGIQLTTNDMIRIGDWIEVPRYSANGTVTDLTMTTVKVSNFDNTITSIPAYTLVSDAFINWRGMQNSGGRRIKRAIYIDISGVRLCDDKMLERFGRIELIKDYIRDKLAEIEKHNSERNFDPSEPVNVRSLTNIGVFRIYIANYLKSNPRLRDDMMLTVRQLEVGDSGIPLEIYAFTNTVNWVEYEIIQSDIFDHLYSVIEQFGLSAYQKPSGKDIRNKEL